MTSIIENTEIQDIDHYIIQSTTIHIYYCENIFITFCMKGEFQIRILIVGYFH